MIMLASFRNMKIGGYGCGQAVVGGAVHRVVHQSVHTSAGHPQQTHTPRSAVHHYGSR